MCIINSMSITIRCTIRQHMHHHHYDYCYMPPCPALWGATRGRRGVRPENQRKRTKIHAALFSSFLFAVGHIAPPPYYIYNIANNIISLIIVMI